MKLIKEMTDKELSKAVAIEVMGLKWVDGGFPGISIDGWKPATGIADAWKVVDRAEFVDVTKTSKGWACAIQFAHGSLSYAPSYTAPRAICEAALMAVRK